MKKLVVLFITAALAATLSCKNKTDEVLPRDAWCQKTEGAAIKSSPDVKSQMIAVIPFGEKISLTEKSDNKKSQSSDDKTGWYKANWNGKIGWINSSSIGGSESVAEQIKISFNNHKKDLDPEIIKAFNPSSVKIINRFVYTGGEMEPAKMFFMPGGVMVLNSKIFTENYSNTFFLYEFVSDGNLLKIKFADKKLNFDEYGSIEETSRSVFKIDKNERTVLYKIKDNGFFFMNWGFYKE